MKDNSNLSNADPSIWKIWIFFSGFFLLFSTLLLNEARLFRGCNLKLESEGKLAEAEYLKGKKNRKGQYLWDLRFSTVEGTVRQAKRVAYLHDGKGMPLATKPTVSVIYSPSDESCWEVSKRASEVAPPLGERGFHFMITAVFGSVFLSIGLLSGGLAWWKLRRF